MEHYKINGAIKGITGQKEYIKALDSLQTVQGLNNALCIMIDEQDRLVELQKMKALNGLVNGIAHEMNTPIGIGVTAASFIETELVELQNKLNSETLDSNELRSTLDIISDSVNLVRCNLKRAALLIDKFKMTAVDSETDKPIHFNLSNHIREIVDCLKYKDELGKCGHLIMTEIPDSVLIHGYPLAIKKIIATLVENSIIHGFKNTDRGLIKMSLVESSHFLVFTYSDNGHGIDGNSVKRVFEPFFTTSMGQGCCGLGMNIVYNLVVHKMKGQIECFSNPGTGLEIVIKLER